MDNTKREWNRIYRESVEDCISMMHKAHVHRVLATDAMRGPDFRRGQQHHKVADAAQQWAAASLSIANAAHDKVVA